VTAIRWEEWGEATFLRARSERKPILLALTATWCRACHRMDEETWEAPGIAARVAAVAIPVRVDADRHPDLYARYHLGGLPSVALLTSDGEFIRGGTFLAPAQLLSFLREGLDEFASGRRHEEVGVQQRDPPVELSTFVDIQVALLQRRFDPEHGGFDPGPKRPHPEALTLLLRQWRASRDSRCAEIVRRSLDALVERLWDAQAGGFFRYAAAADWSHPHTEKIATDQAALIRLLAEAGQRLGEPRYWEFSLGAGTYALGWLADPAGGFFGSQAADPDYYQLAPERQLQAEPPPVDRTVFADATAALAAAFTYAAVVLERPEWEAPGRAALERLMVSAPDGRLPHTLPPSAPLHGWLRDQALGLRAALEVYQLSGERRLLEWGISVAEWTLTHLWDSSRRAFVDAASEGKPLGYLARRLTPILPNAEMAEALVDLSALTGRPRFREVAIALVSSLAGEAERSPAGPALALAAHCLVEDRVEAHLAGDSAVPRARELARTLVRVAGPTALIRWEPGSPAQVTLCTRNLCLPPIEEPKELSDSLNDLDLSA
jgi:uncharacterized protein YyaL (SSP411 family)